jgi:hypothetical protein
MLEPVSDEVLDRVSKYVSLTKELEPDEFRVWKLFERTNKALNAIFRDGTYRDDERKLWISLDVVEKVGLPSLIKQLIAIG